MRHQPTKHVNNSKITRTYDQTMIYNALFVDGDHRWHSMSCDKMQHPKKITQENVVMKTENTYSKNKPYQQHTQSNTKFNFQKSR